MLTGCCSLSTADEHGLCALSHVQGVGEQPAGRREDGAKALQLRGGQRFEQLVGAAGQRFELVGHEVETTPHQPHLYPPDMSPERVPCASRARGKLKHTVGKSERLARVVCGLEKA